MVCRRSPRPKGQLSPSQSSAGRFPNSLRWWMSRRQLMNPARCKRTALRQPRPSRLRCQATSLKLDLNKSFKRGPTQADLAAVEPSGPSSRQRKAPTMPSGSWNRRSAYWPKSEGCSPARRRIGALDVPQLKIVLKELKVPAKAKSSLRPGRSQAPVARK